MPSFDYSSANRRWQRMRHRALERDGYRCQEAARYGKVESATHVHHIWPAEDYPEFAYSLWNLVSLTQANHEKMHHKASRKLTMLGQRWKNRTPPRSIVED